MILYLDMVDLPLGTNGRAISLLSGGIDSPVATWMDCKKRYGGRGSSLPYVIHLQVKGHQEKVRI